jgi:hypothetical protein
MPRLQFGCIGGRPLVAEFLILCPDDLYRALGIVITPELNIGVFEIA